MTEPRRTNVPVAGGQLATFRLGATTPGVPTALAIHGITSNFQAWRPMARAVGDELGIVAADLRGRGASHALPAPFGIAAHVADMVAVLDHFQVAQTVVIGHSLGAYVAASLAVAHPERVSALVLVDGGLTIPLGEGVDPEEFLEAFLGPALARLRMTFADQAAYRAWWGEHPAIAAGDVAPDDLEHYADHDLIGVPPQLRSSVNPEVVRVDGTDLFRLPDASAVTVPARLLCAERGLVDDPNPMQPLELVSAWAAADPGQRQAVPVPDVNHYTITLGRRGAAVIADELRRAVAA